MSWFKRGSSPTPGTRLTRDEAIRIAREAAREDPLAPTLGYAEPSVTGGAVRWTVASVTLDDTLTIVVDDATGMVIQQSRRSGLPRR